MSDEDDELSPIAIAYGWVAKVTTVVGEMVLLGIGGSWLDQRWGTKFLAPVGLMLGVSLGLWHLIVMTKTVNTKRSERSTHKDSTREGGSER